MPKRQPYPEQEVNNLEQQLAHDSFANEGKSATAPALTDRTRVVHAEEHNRDSHLSDG